MNIFDRVLAKSGSAADVSDFAQDAIAGLVAPKKNIPPKYFYDHRGSQLFAQIMQQPEYYPTRTEIGILRINAEKIAELFPRGGALIEFGSGSFVKARILLDAAVALSAYVPVDISGEFLQSQAGLLRHDYPELTVEPIAADFTQDFHLPARIAQLPRAGFFPGSTIGNFEPSAAAELLRNAAGIVGKGAVLVLGVDMIKSPAVLNAAYNDAAGITARFNRNLLRRMNRELGADFDLCAFEHHAFYNRERHRVEMHLVSARRQRVTVAGIPISFRAGEAIHTENSYKYSLASFAALAGSAGWAVISAWTDRQDLFAVIALRAGG